MVSMTQHKASMPDKKLEKEVAVWTDCSESAFLWAFHLPPLRDSLPEVQGQGKGPET